MSARFVQGLAWLVVDDDDAHRSRLVRALCARGKDAHGAANHEQALAFAKTNALGAALVDLKMPGQSGLDVVRDLHALHPDAPLVVLTAYGSIATAVEAMRVGAQNYLTKPADLDHILQAFGAPSPLHHHTKLIQTPSLARVEYEHIERVLRDCEGNISKAARSLGIPRRSLQYKLAKNPALR